MTRTMMLLGASTVQELRGEGRDLLRHRSEAFTRTLPADFPPAQLAYTDLRTP
jgi:L-lactate dehydrogenase (cytochrome)